MEAPSCRTLNTALRHLHEWGQGLESATKLFWHMKALEMDEFDNYACRRLVSIGSNGSDGGKHAQKNLLRMIGDDLGFDKFVTSIAGEGTIRDCILPSTWFQLLARRPHKFINHLGAREHNVLTFLTGLFKSERGQRLRSEHPMLTGRSPESLKHCIPFIYS